MQNVWLRRGALQILVVRRKEEKRKCGNTSMRRSGGGHDTGKTDNLANNEDKECHGKESWEYNYFRCMHHK